MWFRSIVDIIYKEVDIYISCFFVSVILYLDIQLCWFFILECSNGFDAYYFYITLSDEFGCLDSCIGILYESVVALWEWDYLFDIFYLGLFFCVVLKGKSEECLFEEAISCFEGSDVGLEFCE